jgi:hypothetical protein
VEEDGRLLRQHAKKIDWGNFACENPLDCFRAATVVHRELSTSELLLIS